jgi:hypothetical protein
MEDDLAARAIEARQPNLAAHDLVEANRARTSPEERLAGLEGALGSCRAHRAWKPIAFAHEHLLAQIADEEGTT